MKKMKKSASSPDPICETINLLLKESRNSDDETRVLLILQTKSFFAEKLSTAKQDDNNSSLCESAHLLFRIINESIQFFFKEESLADQLDNFLSLFIESSINIQLGTDFSTFILSLFFSNFYETGAKNSFKKFVGHFFENPLFSPFFELSGGLLCLWDLLLSEDKKEFCDFVFDKLNSTIFQYFQNDSTQDAFNFLSHVSNSFLKLPECNAPNAFQFIYSLISGSKQDLVTPFIQFEGFSNINKYIAIKGNPQLLVIYQMFRSMIINLSAEKQISPIIGQLVDLIQIPDVSKEIRSGAFSCLFGTIKQISHEIIPLQPHQLYTISLSIHDDVQSILVYFDMCWYISQHFDYDLSAILPSLSKLCTMKIALEHDVTSLFRLLFSFGDSFFPFAQMFFETLTNGQNEKDLANFFNKYDYTIELYSKCFSENINNAKCKELFLLLIKSGVAVKNQDLYQQIFTRIISKGAIIQMLIEMILKLKNDKDVLVQFFNLIIKVASNSLQLRHQFIENGIVMIIREINESTKLNPTLICDLFASLAGKHFDLSFDAAVSSFLKTMDYFELDSSSLKKLAFGLQHDSESKGNLCFPSILHKIDSFEIDSFFDMWICGQYAIDNWLKETKKPIDKFPSILNISRRFILPHHVPLICENSRLFADACDDTFGLLPLFEFPKNISNSQITFNLNKENENMNVNSLSFWFFFREFPASSQMIVTFHSLSFFATGDDIYVNDQFVSDYRLNRWYHVILTVTDKNKAHVYFDGVLKNQITATISQVVTFGASQANAALWFIGGAIRLFPTVLKEDAIKAIFNRGVSDTITHGTIAITPSDYVDLFDGFNQNASKSLNENSRPVLSFPISRHINKSYDGNRGLFKMILNSFSIQKLEDCHFILNALINLQMNKLSNWDRREFALHMSTLINIAPSLIDAQNFDKIANCFVLETENFDWCAFDTFFLDFGLWNSELRPNVISILFGYFAQYKLTKSSILTKFVFDLIHLIDDLPKEDVNSLFALLERMDMSHKQIIRFLSALPNFSEHILIPTFVYNSENNESPYILPLLNMLKRNIDSSFVNYFCFHILPPVDAFDILHLVITKTNFGPTLDIDFIMHFCILHCYIFKSWSVALSLLYKLPIDVEQGLDEIQPKTINMNVLYHFLIMLGLMLPISNDLPQTSDWFKLPNRFLSDLINNLDLIQLSSIDDNNFKFALMHLLSFCCFQSSITLFPFAPSLTSPDEIIEYATKPSQPFPQNESNQKCPIPPFTFHITDPSYSQSLQTMIRKILPKKLKPVSTVSTSVPLQDYNLNHCIDVLTANSKTKWNDWKEFIQSIRTVFGFDNHEIDVGKIVQSDIFNKIIHFIAAILVKIGNEDKNVQSLLRQLVLWGTFLVPQYSIKLMQSLLLETLTQFNSKKLFNLTLIQFVCNRISEGWFSNSLLNVFSTMIATCENCEKPLPDCLATLSIEMFELISQKDFSQFINNFVNYQHLFFSKENISNPSYVILLLEKFIPRYAARPKQMKSVLTLFTHAMKINDDLQKKWNNTYLQQHPEFDLKVLISGILVLADKGDEKFHEWCQINILVSLALNEVKANEVDFFEQNYLRALKNSLMEMSDDRITLSSNFFTHANNLLVSIHKDILLSKSTASIIRTFERDRLLFSESYFLRVRERMLTKKYGFDEIDSGVLSMSLLSDPLYPTKRVDVSPLIYKMPPFPSGQHSRHFEIHPELSEIPELLPLVPPKIISLLTTPIPQFEDLSLHSKRQVMLSFSQILPLSNSYTVSLLSLILDEFNSLSSVQLLYGVDPITGALLRTQNYLFFVEGINVTNSGACFVCNTTPRIVYTFYMSYFINGSFGPCSLFGAHPVIRLPLDSLIGYNQHYWLHKPTAIELNFIYGWNFIIIPEDEKYQQFFQQLKKDVETSLSHFPKIAPAPTISTLTTITNTPFSNLYNIASPLVSSFLLNRRDPTKLWTDGLIDNFTYLLILNKLGMRAYCDYTQYCVFPWVLSNYTSTELDDDCPDASFRNLSLPMGQIGEERAPRFDLIYEDSENQYFYGTHYMHLGVVLYFMFRIDPYCLFSIYLHRGWDHQNRLFYDFTEAWNAAAYTSPADVKELIPQFYTVPEFLTNMSHLPITTNTEGKSVQDVRLAKWSESPIDFTHKMMHFLQDNRVTKSLNNWIDLIFGYKSRGSAAVDAKNLFHPLCYAKQKKTDRLKLDKTSDLSNDDIESPDEIQRDAAITCVMNFGQCAYQLFTSPHPSNNKPFNRTHLMMNGDLIVHQKLNCNDSPYPITFPISDILILDKDVVTSSGVSCFTFDNEISLKLAKLAIYSTKMKDFMNSQSIMLMPTTQSQKNDMSKSTILFSGDFLLSTSVITCSKDGVFMAIGQREGSISLYRLYYASNNSNEITNSSFIATFPTAGSVSICHISTLHFLLIVASFDHIDRIDIGTRRTLKPIKTQFKINCMAIDEYAGLIIAGGYSQIGVWTISGQEVLQTQIDSSVLSITIPDLYESVENRFLMTGHQNGIVRCWKIDYESNELLLLKNLRLSSYPIKKIAINFDVNRAVAVTDREMFCLDFIGSNAYDLKRDYALECIDCKTPIDKNSVRICSSCHRFFCSKCLPNEQFLKLQTKGQQNKKYMCPHCKTIIENQSNDL